VCGTFQVWQEREKTEVMKDEGRKILLAHGGGGQLSDELIRGTVLSRLKEWGPEGLDDSASLELVAKSILFTTDSYVVKPLFFRGGDIGKLAVCGTVNDLAVCGARPAAMSLSLIIEAGLELEILERILDSVRGAAQENSVRIVTGDIKTVEAGAADKIFINTAGVGVKMKKAKLGFGRIMAGDKVILSGTIGEHGMTIISQREDIKFESEFESDCAGLGGLICGLVEEFGDSIRFMRDPTRGGLAATLNEISRATQKIGRAHV
jgi:hydrogenase expression/formation protein HypE